MKIALDTSSKKAELTEKAKALRDRSIESDIKVFGVMWQVDQKGRDNMRNAIETATRLNMPQGTTQGWILSDNSIRQTTATELEQVLSAYTFRMGQVFVQYAGWRAAGIQKPFFIEGV